VQKNNTQQKNKKNQQTHFFIECLEKHLVKKIFVKCPEKTLGKDLLCQVQKKTP
jgi:hypothetical protein